jgi:hypothetical protein
MRAVEQVLGVRATLSPEASRVTAPMADAERVADLLITLREAGVRLAEMSVQKPTLDEVFLTLTGHDAADQNDERPGEGGGARMTALVQEIVPIVPARDRDLRNRTSLAQAVENTLTMAYRGLIKIRRTPEQLIDVTVQPIIFTLMFAYLFGGAIAGDVKNYLPSLIPGILVQTVITTSVVTGTQLREDMDKGVFDRFRSLPIARIAPLSGALLADTIRYAIATTLTFVMGYIMGTTRPAASDSSSWRACW